jgi:hypothetical protein
MKSSERFAIASQNDFTIHTKCSTRKRKHMSVSRGGTQNALRVLRVLRQQD